MAVGPGAVLASYSLLNWPHLPLYSRLPLLGLLRILLGLGLLLLGLLLLGLLLLGLVLPVLLLQGGQGQAQGGQVLCGQCSLLLLLHPPFLQPSPKQGQPAQPDIEGPANGCRWLAAKPGLAGWPALHQDWQGGPQGLPSGLRQAGA